MELIAMPFLLLGDLLRYPAFWARLS